LSDVGGTIGPALLSAVTAAATLAAGLVATGAVALLGAGLLGHWIPRAGARPTRRTP
ncbi:MAG: MFS transporter, partial [Rubrivivax sp.]|nr:MFS transporter [Rubrivivax sp.]